jgi:copper homeostasis protein (lipoprotein)
MQGKLVRYLMFAVSIGLCSCHGNPGHTKHYAVFKGVYSFGPEVKLFTDENSGHEFWVADSSEQLELQYSQLKFEKPYEPVYIELEGIKKHSDKDGLGAEYDSTIVVKKLIKITKEIPDVMSSAADDTGKYKVQKRDSGKNKTSNK